jgi:hypothetical protein
MGRTAMVELQGTPALAGAPGKIRPPARRSTGKIGGTLLEKRRETVAWASKKAQPDTT